MNFVVIGASRGLGLALTRMLLESGHKVAASTRKPAAALDELAALYRDSLLVFEGDVTDEDQMHRGVRASQEFLGAIDAVCTAAGVLLDGDRKLKLHECDIAELRHTLDVNTVGPVIVAKTFYPHLRPGARVFTVTSEGVGVKSCGTWVPCYGLSKTAATKSCGILNASVEDVDFFAVHPGRMNTDMGRTTAQIEPEEAAAGFVRLMTGETPLSRGNWYIDYNGRPMEA